MAGVGVGKCTVTLQTIGLFFVAFAGVAARLFGMEWRLPEVAR